MSKKIMQFSKKLVAIIPMLALILAMHSVKATCFFCLHQPDVPEELL